MENKNDGLLYIAGCQPPTYERETLVISSIIGVAGCNHIKNLLLI